MKAKLIKQNNGYLLFDEKGIPISTLPNILNETFSKLSLKNCQAIERGYDLDELADEYSDVFDAFTDDRFDAFKAGFQKALDIYHNDLNILPRKIEWDVQVDMEPYHDGNFVRDGKTHSFEPKWRPKLDADGCLILKRVNL